MYKPKNEKQQKDKHLLDVLFFIILLKHHLLRIRAMHEANTALLDILVDNSVII